MFYASKINRRSPLMFCNYFLMFFCFLSCALFASDDIIDIGKSNSLENRYYDISNEPSLAYALESPVDPKKYRVGPGDKFLLHMIYPSGIINTEILISPLGDVLIPQVGIVDVNDMYLDEAMSTIKYKCLEKYQNADVNLTLSEIKRFKVKVIGAIKSTGYKVVTSVDRVSDVLSGMLNDKSSRRNIQLIRGKNITQVDLTQFWMTGKNYLNPLLENGDIIKVNYLKDSVFINGGVNGEGTYEYVKDETLYDLIVTAGGFSVDSDSTSIQVTRFINDVDYREIDISSILESKKIILEPRDYIYIKKKGDYKRHNTVSVSGEINYPGSYTIKLDSIEVGDLLEKCGGYTSRADIGQIRINNDMIQSRGDKELDRIMNIDPENRSNTDKSYVKARSFITKGKISSNEQSFTKNILSYILKPGDTVHIPTRLDYIEVIGGVVHPGRYPIKDSNNIKDYISDAGGKTKNATRKKYLIKSSTGQRLPFTNASIIESGDIIFVEERNDYNDWDRYKEIINVVYQIIIAFSVLDNLER